MSKKIRVGLQIIPDETFSIQVGIAIEQEAQQANVELVPVDISPVEVSGLDYADVLEQLLAQELDSLIILELPQPLIKLIVQNNIQIISLAAQLGCHEKNCNHPAVAAPLGLYNIAQTMTTYLIERLQGRGKVLIVGGLKGVGEDGRSSIAGIRDTLAPMEAVQIYHIPTAWRYDLAYQQTLAGLKGLSSPLNAIFGLSDSVALAGRKAAEELGLLNPDTLVAGINGDPQALNAIARGKMAATIELSTVELGKNAVELALRAASGQSLPLHFNFKSRLITPHNLTEVAAQKLFAIAELPSYLIDVNRQREHQRLTQLETSLAINHQINAILDRSILIRTIVNLIRSNYNYDRVLLYLWSEKDKALILDDPEFLSLSTEKVHFTDDGVLASVFRSRELIFVPDIRHSHRFTQDPYWPELRTRVVLPVKKDGEVLGVLDLQKDYVTHYSNEQLMGLQLLADQLAIAMSNADLYKQALAARKMAEKADKLKTRLLANVSHEFRTPLNIILGYTKSALTVPNSYNLELPAELKSDLGYVYQSGEHLMRLINDLLDLSRAEIDELEIFPQILDTRQFLQEVFHSIANMMDEVAPVKWRFVTPDYLPLLQADPLRLRQILLNLLSNANKFTQQGSITLSAEVCPPYVHIAVADTGNGISSEMQEQIFEPFMVGETSDRHSGGIGLGLTITRRLVALHGGSMRVESQPGQGSIFHIYLPLPNLSGQVLTLPPTLAVQQVQKLVCITNGPELPPEVEMLNCQVNIQVQRLRPSEVIQNLVDMRPSILAWDAATAQENDWLVLDYLRKTPQLAQLPLILSGNSLSISGQTGTTNILLKPFSGQTLQTFLEILRPTPSRDGVLVVDDDIKSLDLYEQLLRIALPSITVHRAEGGQHALNLLQKLVPDLIMIDLMMPEVDGYEVIEWVRSNPSTQNVPVLVISGKVLSAEYIERLDFARLALHSKDILNEVETTHLLQQTLSGRVLLPQHTSILIKRTVAYLQQNFDQPLSLQKIAQEIGISRNYLVRNFHQELGISPWEYLNRYRVKEAKRLLETSDLSITEVAAQIGFDDPAYFSRIFRSHSGQSPKEYRNRQIC